MHPSEPQVIIGVDYTLGDETCVIWRVENGKAVTIEQYKVKGETNAHSESKSNG